MPEESQIGAFDALSYTLEALGLRALIYARVEASGSWGIEMPPGEPYFHAVLSGAASVATQDGPNFDLRQGDILFGLKGEGHTILSDLDAQSSPLDDLVKTSWSTDGLLKLGAEPVDAVLACGFFSTSQKQLVDVLSGAPDHLTVRSGGANALEPVGLCLALLQIESKSRHPGSGIICARLIDIALTFAIRDWIENNDPQKSFATASDRAIALALEAMRSDPTASVDDIAKVVGLSRSAFAARFQKVVGQSPGAYALEHRMKLADSMLSAGIRVGEVASRLGYRSDSAFSRAYRRLRGKSPRAQKG